MNTQKPVKKTTEKVRSTMMEDGSLIDPEYFAPVTFSCRIQALRLLS